MSFLPSASLVYALLAANAFKATVLLAITLCLLWFARRSSAAVRHQLCALGLGGIVVLPVLHFAMPGWTPQSAGSATFFWDGSFATAVSRPQPVVGEAVRAVVNGSPELTWTSWIVVLWLAGVAICLIRLFSGIIALRWRTLNASHCMDEEILRITGELSPRRKPHILLGCSDQMIPCTWGLLRPRVVLPKSCASWTSERKRIVLSHELTHIERFDWALLIAAEIVRSLFWFHPLVWLAVHRLREESELACDDTLLARGLDPLRYAAELLEIVRHASRPSAAALAIARTSSLERRFNAMLDPTVNRRSLSRRASIFTSAIALTVLLPLASLRAPGQELAGQFMGTVLDSRNNPVQNATVVMKVSGSGANSSANRFMTATDATGTFRFESLPPGQYELGVLRVGFSTATTTQVLEAARSGAATVTLQPETPEEAEQKAKAEIRPAGTPPSRIRVGGNVQATNLVVKKSPVYPQSAKSNGIQGRVMLEASIDMEGVPVSLRVANPEIDPDLARSAVETVSQWRYKPVLLNGDPVNVETLVAVNFTLSK